MTAPLPTLDIANLTVTRRGRRGDRVTVLDDVSLTVAPGECLAIVGASGSGKSVFARTLLGLTDPSAGANIGGTDWRVGARRLDITGHDMRQASRRAWRKLRGPHIALVLQDALQSLDPLRTIQAEIEEALAIRSGGILGGDSAGGGARSLARGRAERRDRVVSALNAAGLPDPESLLSLRSDALSGGMRQRALIASALIAEPQVLVADEPTTALDPVTAQQVLQEFGRLRDAGTSLVVVSHDLGAIAKIADRIAVLDGGRIVETGSAHEILTAPTHAAARALVDAIPTPRLAAATLTSAPNTAPTTDDQHRNQEPLITLTEATRSFGTRAGKKLGIHDATLAIHRGEILGIAGGSGEGKTTLARIISGADPLDSGDRVLSPAAKVRLIPQDPLATFDPRWRVQRILEATLTRNHRASGDAPTPAAIMRRVGLSPKLLSGKPATLSGGERQRVAIGRALAAAPDVLIADEAVSALDTVTQAGILSLLQSLKDELGIVFVSHDITMLASVSDRITVVQNGRIASDEATNAFLQAALAPTH